MFIKRENNTEHSEIYFPKTLFFVFCILILVRFCISDRLSVYIIGNSPHDDLWVVRAANSILEGEWFGEYNQYTLIKGAFCPLLMAFSQKIGLTYLNMYTILYIVSCLIFSAALSPLLKNNISKIVVFAAVLFNPISFATETFQRVYRNGHSQWQLLLIFGCIIGAYLRRNKKISQIIPWALMGGLSLWAFVNTREDSIWIMPFVIVAAIVSAGWAAFFEKKENDRPPVRSRILKAFVMFIPLIIMFVGNSCLKYMNYKYYGCALLNDRTKGGFVSFIDDLYLIKRDEAAEQKYTDETLPYAFYQYNIYHDSLKKAYEASPTLKKAENDIENAIALWDSGEEIVDSELIYDHMLFAIRDGVAAAGYYSSLKNSEEFYSSVHSELQAAFRNGALEKGEGGIIPNAVPLYNKKISDVFKVIPKMVEFVINYTDINTNITYASGSTDYIELFEKITGNYSLEEPQRYTEISGWAFADDKYGSFSVFVCKEDGTPITPIVQIETDDIYNYFNELGYMCNNAKRARYSARLDNISDITNLIMSFYDQHGNLIKSVEFAKMNCFEGDVRYCLDSAVYYDSQEKYDFLSDNVSVCNKITRIYQVITPILFTAAIAGWVFILVYAVYTGIRQKNIPVFVFDSMITVSSIALSLFVFWTALAYVHVSAFPTINYLYLSSSYIMTIMFTFLSITLSIKTAVHFPLKKFWDKAGEE